MINSGSLCGRAHVSHLSQAVPVQSPLLVRRSGTVLQDPVTGNVETVLLDPATRNVGTVLQDSQLGM